MSNVTPIRPHITKAVSAVRGEYLTFRVAGQSFAIPATSVQDILRLPTLTSVPLARPEIVGLLNLRGHIVTAVSLNVCLGGEHDAGARAMAVVINHDGEPACLIVEEVGDVVALTAADMEPNPASMGAKWSSLSRGIFKISDALLVVLDVENVLNFRAL